jgi:hypothetical protein
VKTSNNSKTEIIQNEHWESTKQFKNRDNKPDTKTSDNKPDTKTSDNKPDKNHW